MQTVLIKLVNKHYFTGTGQPHIVSPYHTGILPVATHSLVTAPQKVQSRVVVRKRTYFGNGSLTGTLFRSYTYLDVMSQSYGEAISRRTICVLDKNELTYREVWRGLALFTALLHSVKIFAMPTLPKRLHLEKQLPPTKSIDRSLS